MSTSTYTVDRHDLRPLRAARSPRRSPQSPASPASTSTSRRRSRSTVVSDGPLDDAAVRGRRRRGRLRAGRPTGPAAPMTARPDPDVELVIGGMTCASCAARIEKKLNRMDGVTATVNYATEKAQVSFDAGVAAEDLVATVEATGLHRRAARCRRGPPTRPSRRRAATPTARLRQRLVVCGACAVPGRRCWRWCRRCSSTTGSGSR